MILTPEELETVNERMVTYHITYQEIYDEILDHIINAAETARKDGDQRNIEPLFDEIMNTHFGGSKGLRKIVFQNVMAYNKKVSKEFKTNFKSYLNWQIVVLIAIIIIASFYLPETKTVNAILLFAVIIASFFPVFYALIKTWGIKTIKRKQSLAKAHVMGFSQRLTIITYVILFVPRFIPNAWHLSFLNPLRYSPFIYVTLLCLFVIYTLSTIQLYKQVFKVNV